MLGYTKFKTSKNLLIAKKKYGGRNNLGRITVHHQGGGVKQFYRIINWSRKEHFGFIANFEYDPNRTTKLAKLYHLEKNFLLSNIKSKLKEPKLLISYILAPKGLKIFDKIRTFIGRMDGGLLLPGDCAELQNFEAGDFVHAVENIPNKIPLFARAAGTYCQILQYSSKIYIKVRLPSGSQRLISKYAYATAGTLSNEKHYKKNLKKAGRSRWLNKRPSVRGVAMNPVDHPHGGGQGKTKGGRPSVTPWSLPTKGQPTRNIRKVNELILTVRKRKKRK